MVLSLLPAAALAAEVPTGDTEAVSADTESTGDTKGTTAPSANTENTKDPEEDKEVPEDTGETGSTEDTGDTKDPEDETSKGPQWNFAPQQTGYSLGSDYSYYYNSSWRYDVDGYPGVPNYSYANTVWLRQNTLPDEINALIKAVEDAHPTTYEEIQAVAQKAVTSGAISQQLYDRFCPDPEKDGSVVFHAPDSGNNSYDIRFRYTDGAWVATVETCLDPAAHKAEGEAVGKAHLALRNGWSGNGQRYLLFRGLVTKVTYEADVSNFTGASAAFAKFYNLTDADLANWPTAKIDNNTFMSTSLAGADGVLDLSKLPAKVTNIGGYAFGRYVGDGLGNAITTVLLPEDMTTLTLSENAFSNASAAVTIKGRLTDAAAISAIKSLGYNYIDLITYSEGDIANDSIHWIFNDGTLTLTGTGAIPDYTTGEASNRAPWADKAITSLSIGEGITGIGACAFHNQTGLTGTVTLPGTVKTVGDRAFALAEAGGASLRLVYQKGITIAENARENRTEASEADREVLASGNYGSIAKGGDWDADGVFQEPVLSNNVIYMIYRDGSDLVMELSGTGATASFSYGAGQPQIDKDGHNNPQPEEIRGEDGYGRKVTKLIIDEGITSVGYCAFEFFTSLKEVVLPASLTTIGSNAFHRALADGAKLYGAQDGYNTELGNKGYTIQFPRTVKTIGTYFGKYGSTGAEFDQVYFANPDTKIDVTSRSGLFSNPDDITLAVNNKGADCQVRTWARTYSIKFKDLSDQNAVDEQTDKANGITYEVTGGTLYINAINDPLEATTANVPANLLTPEQIRYVTKIVIGNGVKTIAADAFFGYTNVTEVTLPNTLESIGSKAFGVTDENRSLTTIRIGKAATVADDAFENRTLEVANVGKDAQKTAFEGVATTINVDNTYSVLLIGNSYSEDASNCAPMTFSRLQQMLQNAYPDKDVVVGLCYSGGKTMAWHYDKALKGASAYSLRIAKGDGTWTSAGNMSSAAALSYMDWDVVSLQPYAKETREGTGYNYSDNDKGEESYNNSYITYEYTLDESFGYMLHYVHCYAPSAQTYLYMTWQEVSDNTNLNAGADDYAKIVENLVTKSERYYGHYFKDSAGKISDSKAAGAQETKTDEHFADVIPVGTAVQNERSTYFALLAHNVEAISGSVNLTSDPVRGLQRDSGHLSYNIGRYTAALTFAQKLTGKDSDTLMKNIDVYPGTGLQKFPADYRAIMAAAVTNAIKQPSQVTPFDAAYAVDPAVQAKTAVEAASYAYHLSAAADYTEKDLATRVQTAVDNAVSALKTKYPELTVSIAYTDKTAPTNNASGSFTADVTITYGYTTVTASITGMITADHHHNLTKTSTQPILVPSSSENGTVSVSPKNAKKGATVTITVSPDKGYEVSNVTVKDAKGNTIQLTDQGNGTYTFVMPDSAVSVSASFAASSTGSVFADVPADAYCADAVAWAVENGITNGKANGLFGTNDPCTRGQIVTFLWRAAGSPEPKGSASVFTDVSADAYYAKAVAWAVENGITNGATATTFAPDATCTRAQSVTFLFRAIGKLAGSKAAFGDVSAESYYAGAVDWAVENGVTKGTTDTTFSPDATCTRGQIVTFLYRAYQGK